MFNSQECYFKGKKYSMNRFLQKKKTIKKVLSNKLDIFDESGNKLIFANGGIVKPYFRRLTSNDTNEMSDWHKQWQNRFSDCAEKIIKVEGMTRKYRRADVDLNETQVIEFQHSNITGDEVSKRKHDYALVNKEIIWVIDGNQSVEFTKLSHGNYFVEFAESWKFDSFNDYEVVYLNKGDKVYPIFPKNIKNNMIEIQSPISCNRFCKRLLKCKQLFDVLQIPQTTIYIKQQGAGNGKTYGIANLLNENEDWLKEHPENMDMKLYDTFIYLTKQNSAKRIIYEEFIKDNKLCGTLAEFYDLFSHEEVSNKYVLKIVHRKTKKQYNMIIATMDSFNWALGNTQKSSIDKFVTNIHNIINTNVTLSSVKYAGKSIKLDQKTLLIGDEMQDLHEDYMKAIIKISRDRYLDFYAVGDELQSITRSDNAFTYLKNHVFPEGINIVKPKSVNEVMRFSSQKIIDYVNSIVPFEKYKLPSIIKHPNNKFDDANTGIFTFYGKEVRATDTDESIINSEIYQIMEYYTREVSENGCVPKDFLIITAFTKKNPLVEALNLSIRDFWKRKYNTKTYEHYSIFHKSEDGSSIKLEESENSTRIVSIHTSKGDGRPVVFLIGLTEDALKKYSEEANNLVYDSLLHVALTRMKKRLYIRLCNNGDDLCNKLSGKDTELSPSIHIDHKKKFEIDKILDKLKFDCFDIVYETIIKGTPYEKITPEDDDQLTKPMIIDMKHHLARRASMHVLFLLSTANCVILRNKKKGSKFVSQQLFPLMKNCVSYEIVHCDTTKQYNNVLWKKDNNQLPIFKYDAISKEYGKYYDELIKLIKDNRLKISDFLNGKNHDEIELDDIHSLCLYHMIEICESRYRCILPITDMYDIIDLYIKSSEDEHNEYRKSHYEKLQYVKNICKQINDQYVDLRYLWNQKVSFNGMNESLQICNSYEFLAYNDTHVLIFKLHSQYNDLNYNTILYDMIFDILLVNNIKIDTDNDAKGILKFSNKKIIGVIVTLDRPKPIYIDFETEIKQHKNILSCILKNNTETIFQIKNKGLYYFYVYNVEQMKEAKPIDIITKIKEGLEKINEDSKCDFPAYVLSFFDKMIGKIEDMDVSQARQLIDQHLDKDYFLNKINMFMSEQLNKYFGLQPDDIVHFKKVQEDIKNKKYNIFENQEEDNVSYESDGCSIGDEDYHDAFHNSEGDNVKKKSVFGKITEKSSDKSTGQLTVEDQITIDMQYIKMLHINNKKRKQYLSDQMKKVLNFAI